ncbi:hypothetical protein [Pseudomonas sp. ML96]|uniref:hypothetical protein n=1 Tax=Pseudomonas sp. ML96 TaxID=1523503 RepID=UPI0005BC94B8|nr:hypothetical protein [Pseudomonas sp. ML96]
MNARRLLLALILLTLFAFGWQWLRPPGEAPQVSVPNGVIRLNGHTITPLQPFQLEALVLSREDYRFDRGAKVSPTDLALGWGPMADPQVLARIDISQGNRWYRWRTADFPIPRRDIETHSANMHLIPADKAVARALERVEPGQRIALQGQLVRVDGDDGFRWQSSLSRDDTGQGACELIWVEHLSALD